MHWLFVRLDRSTHRDAALDVGDELDKRQLDGREGCPNVFPFSGPWPGASVTP